MAATANERHVVPAEESSIFDLPEAPVFYPTPEEFRDPWTFLNKIRHIIQKTGICVIQPPHEEDGWDFESFYKYVDPKAFQIITKAQNVHQMQQRNGPSVQFARDLIKFWASNGRPMNFLPEVNGIVVDFRRLKDEVDALGGFAQVEAASLWRKVASIMRLTSPKDLEEIATIAAMTLRNHYVQYLQPFLTGVVPSLTSPSPAPASAPAAAPAPAPPAKIQKRCKECKVLLQFPPETAMIKCPKCQVISKTADLIPVVPAAPKPAAAPTPSTASASPAPAPAPAPAPTSQPATPKPKPEMVMMKCTNEKCKVALQFPKGTQAIKCPKCTIVMRIPANAVLQPAPVKKEEAKKEEVKKEEPKKEAKKPEVKPEVKKEIPMKQETGMKSVPMSDRMKRQLESGDCDESSTSNKRRRFENEPLWKQVRSRSFAKEDYDRRVGANESDDMDVDSDEEEEKVKTETHTGGRMGGMMARKVFKNKKTEESESEEEDILERLTKDFGYDMGYTYTLEEYKGMADLFAARWADTCSTIHDKEREYWRIVEGGSEWVHVQYGSDLDCGKHGSGFPMNPDAKERTHALRAKHWLKARRRRRKPAPSEYMTKSGWNTHNLADATFLHHINESVAGVTRSMIYVGMLFSSFCWHTEDNYLYSINYLHTGSPKKWYGVPGEGADQFEKVMREMLPDLFAKTPNLLHLLVTQMSPNILVPGGVPVYTATQKKGQFVITCPRSYHAGFNTGFNVAESVNFALEDWLPICRKAVKDYRFSRSAVVPYEEMVIKAAEKPDNPEVARIVQAELVNVISTEQRLLYEVFKSGITQFVDISSQSYRSCEHCGYDCYVSGIVCNTHSNLIGCLHHAKEFCVCGNDQKRLGIRVRLSEMKELLDKLNEYLGENTIIEGNGGQPSSPSSAAQSPPQ